MLSYKFALSMSRSAKSVHHRLFSTASAAIQRSTSKDNSNVEPTTSDGKRWQLMAAVFLERYPIISPLPTELEIRYKEMLRKMEDENSLLSFHELRRMEEARAAKKAAKAGGIIEGDERQLVTAQDFEDASVAERKRFSAASRSSDAEDANFKSLHRLMDKKLVFLIPSAYTKNSWRLPSTMLREGESLVQAAQRIIYECLEISPAAIFYGNAPRKLYKYTYPSPVKAKTGADGAKVFLFKAEIDRQAKVRPQVQEYRWLSKNEIDNTIIVNRRYRQCIQSFFFE